MKVVLFCGGLGTRIREHSERIPKPLVNIGNRPIVWHLMRYYAHFGHKDFILCLGYGGDLIRQFFLDYNECLSNDFVLSMATRNFASLDTNNDGQISRSEWDAHFDESGFGSSGSSSSGTTGAGSSSRTTRSPGGKKIELLASDVQDWRITFVDTGLHSNIGERLLRVRRFLEGENAFLANYSDGLTDLPLDRHIADFERRGVVASLVAVPPPVSFHSMQSDSSGLVTGFGAMRDAGLLINGGFFCMRPEIFNYIQRGEDLIEAFQRLGGRRQLAAFHYGGFWQAMDTFKDKMAFDSMHARGECPWMLWKQNGHEEERPATRSDVDAAETANLLLDATVLPGRQRSSA
jgi:glucose-1-phosphate cytidylyltransferase